MTYYFEKQVKKTERADNINSVSPARLYPCLKLVFNDNWNDYGYYTWFHLWYLVDSDKKNWRSLGDVKIIHKTGEVYECMPEDFTELDKNFCSLGINLNYYKSLLDVFGRDGAKEALHVLQDCALDTTIKERFNTTNPYNASLIRDISTLQVLEDALFFVEDEDPDKAYSFGYHFVPPYNGDCCVDWNVNFEFSAKKYQRVVTIIGENGVGKTQLLSNMLRDLVENKTERFDHMPLLKNVLVLCSSEYDSYCLIKEEDDDYKVRRLSLVQDDRTLLKVEESILAIIDRETLLAHGQMLSMWQHYVKLLEQQFGSEVGNLFFFSSKTQDGDYLRPELDKVLLEKMVKEFSTGQLQIFSLITHVCAYIHLNSLVVLDEPEIHLHPRLITDFFLCLGELLHYFSSYALVPTHSPLVIRECVNENVFLMQRSMDDIVQIGKVPFRTFGQDLTVLYENVFGCQENKTFYYRIVRELAEKRKATYSKVVEKLENEGVKLDINSRSIIKEVFMELESEVKE